MDELRYGVRRERERGLGWVWLPFGELVTDLETDGLDAASGEIGLVGVEMVGVGRYHLRHQTVHAAL